MSRLLVQIVTGPEIPTRVALALLLAKTALAAGHDVDVFFAGDGVNVLRPETIDAGHGVGTGAFREHVDDLVSGGAGFYASAMSSKARGVTADTVGGLAVTFSAPTGLVELIFKADRVLIY